MKTLGFDATWRQYRDGQSPTGWRGVVTFPIALAAYLFMIALFIAIYACITLLAVGLFMVGGPWFFVGAIALCAYIAGYLHD